MIKTLFAAAVLSASALAPVAAQTLHFRLQADPQTLYNVQSISNIVDGVLGNYLLERLVYVDAQGLPQPWLAESWVLSADQKTVSFKLRSGVKFHDGTDFNAAAVKFHFDAIRDPKNASPLLSMIGPLERVETPDPQTVTLVFSRPYGPLLNNLSLGFMGINSPTAVNKAGKSYGRKPVGTGPFKLQRWTPGSELRLERYADYRQFRRDAVNQGPAHAQTVVLHVIREDAVAAAALESGELTAADLQPDVVPRFERDKRFRVVTNKNVKLLAFIDMNQHRPPFDDVNFRRAVSMSIDRQAVVRGAMGGYATEMSTPLAPGIPGFDKALAAKAELGYAPDKARALLAAAGWKLKDGVLERDGRPARFVMRGVSGSDTVDRALAVIQSNLKAVGIQVTLETSDWGAMYPSLLNNDWEMAMMGWTWPDGSVMGNLWRSPGHRKHLKANPTLDALFLRCDSMLDAAPRNSCLAQAQRLLVEQVQVVPVASRWDQYAVQAGVRDFTVDAGGYLLPGDVKVQP
ncbi:MAG: hypothetical protein C0423_14085 [Methylibium sp.]|nr:hypothetical protein [Methylibium sp.]